MSTLQLSMSNGPVPAPIDKPETDSIPDQFIVLLKPQPEHTLKDHIGRVGQLQNDALDSVGSCEVVREYKSNGFAVIKGYQAKLRGTALDDLAKRPEVSCIIQDRQGTLDADQEANINVAVNAPWNLARLSRLGPLPADAIPQALAHDYRSSNLPCPVNVYVLDTGIKVDHAQFQLPDGERRASFGANFSGGGDGDTNGHGTHVAGTIGGNDIGVATGRGVAIISVKVAGGTNSFANTLTGMEWALAHAQNTGIPSIINMSLRFDPVFPIDPLEDLVNEAVALGVHVVVSAGNRNTDARTQTPASIPNALAVGASTITDQRAGFSNYGPRVGIFAPGDRIISAGIENNAAFAEMSGTSMATPLVTGTIAYLIQKEGNRTPAAMIARLEELAHKGVLGGIPNGTK
ncbi:subtilisin-like serine protease [Ceratobasidium sp. 423]|nr:subtilisin-like serine protease [Ceratobasidium sp. 423]